VAGGAVYVGSDDGYVYAIAAVEQVFTTVGATTSPVDTIQKVIPSERAFSFEDFQAVGFKRTREYNVDALPQATGASYGFWRSQDQDPADYELRSYPSHETAVEHGATLAEEVTGRDAVLRKADMTWQEGAGDRQVRVVGEGISPRYADFAIFGNIVMLCQGRDSMESLERCEALIDTLSTE